MPHTPLPSFPDDPFPRTHIPSASHLTPGTTTAPNIHPNPPRTPYTPFTAFASKQNPFALSQASALGAAHLLDEAEDALARVYNQVLRFVERDLKRIMAIGEKVCLRSGAGEKAKDLNRVLGQGKEKENGVAGKEKGGQGGFEMLANVIWAEFGRAIMDEMGSSVFAAGRPDEFRMVRGFISLTPFVDRGGYSTMKRPRHSYAPSNFWRHLFMPLKLCDLIQFM